MLYFSETSSRLSGYWLMAFSSVMLAAALSGQTSLALDETVTAKHTAVTLVRLSYDAFESAELKVELATTAVDGIGVYILDCDRLALSDQTLGSDEGMAIAQSDTSGEVSISLQTDTSLGPHVFAILVESLSPTASATYSGEVSVIATDVTLSKVASESIASDGDLHRAEQVAYRFVEFDATTQADSFASFFSLNFGAQTSELSFHVEAAGTGLSAIQVADVTLTGIPVPLATFTATAGVVDGVAAIAMEKQGLVRLQVLAVPLAGEDGSYDLTVVTDTAHPMLAYNPLSSNQPDSDEEQTKSTLDALTGCSLSRQAHATLVMAMLLLLFWGARQGHKHEQGT